MANEVPTIRRVFLADRSPRRTGAQSRSAHHTIYAGSAPLAPGMAAQPLTKLEFIGGVARDVDPQVYEQLAALGHVQKDRPRSPQEVQDAWEDDQR